ncbi:hypothetical protein ABD91_25930 [Lysinibacillus sphaericus]|uniref:AAA family ATPase n=1 Tax=Lysinibacillus sphaericus TaxID=1421 RepID=UPI0018CE1510|nr:ATP-binding protein [Lysinibacillus sphaericus]MBG9694174.1 hypothetical protein [Lysinibacillus sphaericus]
MKETNVGWYTELVNHYMSGVSNVFLLTGNIYDYMTEAKLLKEFLKEELEGKFNSITLYNISKQGVDIYNDDPDLKGDLGSYEWDEMILSLKSIKRKQCLIVEYPEFFLSQGPNGHISDEEKKKIVDLNELFMSKEFVMSKNMVIFISESKSGIHPMLLSANSRISVINIEFPNFEERKETINYLTDRGTFEFENDLTSAELSRITAGLSRLHIEDIFLIAHQNGVLDKDMIIERKKELIERQFGQLIEMVDTDRYSLDDFSGQEHLKSYHLEAIVNPILAGDLNSVPKGLLYSGPPGTGKTYFANCLAGSAKINFIEFKMSKILDKWVGEAEKNLEKAFNCFNSLTPVIVFIDEIDQALSRGNGSDSNSVRSNMFGMFLSFLSKPENRGNILFIGATNYPNQLDEALKRAGRFDKKIPFMLPSKEERSNVIEYHVNKCSVVNNLDKEDFDAIADNTNDYSPAELENIVVKTLELCKRRKLDLIDKTLIDEAMEYILSAKNPKIEEMTDLAIQECNDLEFLPDRYLERYKKLLSEGKIANR